VRHKPIILLTFLALLLGLPAAATAGGDQGHGDDNAAVAINTEDGSSRFRFAFALDRERDDVVDNQNGALAYSSCESCRTTAIAVQIVLVVGSPSTVTPTNAALALNENCTACESFATAFQFVVGVADESVGFTRTGKRQLKDIVGEFRSLRHDEYTVDEFHARTNALADRLRTLLRTELVPRTEDDDEDKADELEEDVTTSRAADSAEGAAEAS
jgi:hypothetical protein